jgi:hypothetical protein
MFTQKKPQNYPHGIIKNHGHNIFQQKRQIKALCSETRFGGFSRWISSRVFQNGHCKLSIFKFLRKEYQK